MGKIAVLSDPHLIHRYHKNYDKISEFKRLVNLIMSYNPEKVLILGDFVDKKFVFQGHPISYIDGSKYQIPIVKIIKDTEINWYALLGNHGDKNILQSISQAADNFHYMETNTTVILDNDADTNNNFLETSNAFYWFANIGVNESYLEIGKKIKNICQAVSQYPAKNKKNVLLTHLDFVKKGLNIGLEDELINTISSSFDLILNGHEHVYQKKFKRENIVLVPCALPAWVSVGSGSVQNFIFKDGQLITKGKQKNPYGFLILDEELLNHEFIPFQPYSPTVEVLYDVSGKDLSQIDTDWRIITQKVAGFLLDKEEFKSIIIIPQFTGNMVQLYKIDVNRIITIISNDFEDIFLVDFRGKDLITTPLTMDKLEDEGELLNIEKVFEKTLEQIEDIKKLLKEKKINLTIDQISLLVSSIRLLDDNIFYTREKISINNYIADIIKKVLTNFNEFLNSDYLPIDIINILDASLKKEVN